MVTLLQDFFDHVATTLDGEVLAFRFQKSWGSQSPAHRIKIREALLDYLKRNHSDEVNDSVLDLEALPTLHRLFVSISHCSDMGGYVVCSQPVGFDIENTSRLNPKVVGRVSTSEERSVAPGHEALWVAKEAVYKCDNSFKTISQISLSGWDLVQDETYRFRIGDITGWSQKRLDFSYAIAIKKS